MTEDEIEKLAIEKSAEYAGLSNHWDPTRRGYKAGFTDAYDLLTKQPAKKPVNRSWEIVSGDPRAVGYENKFAHLNKAYESLEFLRESQPDIEWELKERSE